MSFLTTPAGVRLRYTDRGSGDRTIVLVHGWKGSHRLWDPAVYRLMRDFRVIAFDNRGMGESDKPAGPYDFSVLADDLGLRARGAVSERRDAGRLVDGVLDLARVPVARRRRRREARADERTAEADADAGVPVDDER